MLVSEKRKFGKTEAVAFRKTCFRCLSLRGTYANVDFVRYSLTEFNELYFVLNDTKPNNINSVEISGRGKRLDRLRTLPILPGIMPLQVSNFAF